MVYATSTGDTERPPFVRAASGITSFRGELVVVQDDNNYLGAVTSLEGEVALAREIVLPAHHDGRRRFEKERGNKLDKLDLESVVTLTHGGRELLVGVGSGSHAARERWLLHDGETAELRDAGALYAVLRAAMGEAAGSLNLEGVAATSARFELFHRGNGFRPGDPSGLPPARFTFDRGAIDAWLFERGPVPSLIELATFDLGSIEGVAYGFTDACALDEDRVAFIAGAEDSPNTVDDGVVLGSIVGIVERDHARFTLLEPTSAPVKAEGLWIPAPEAKERRAMLVVDPDDIAAAAVLSELRLRGFA